jgi:hypothetical protein
VEIHIRHLSGSRAGSEQTFDLPSIRIGRDPKDNDLAFDPNRDLLVSGHHAVVSFDGKRWTIRDLDSSNGTYIDGERITTRPLKSGERVELGRGGPMIEIRYEQPALKRTISDTMIGERAGTGVLSVKELMAGQATGNQRLPQAPSTDGTAVLSSEEVSAIRAEAGRGTPPTTRVAAGQTKKSSPLLRIVLIALLTIVAGLILVVATSDKKKPTEAATTSSAPDPANAELDRLKKELAQREADLQRAQQQQAQTASTDTTGVLSKDLERQNRDAQAVIDRLRQELEQKNDEVTRARQREPRTIVKYVVQPAPATPAPQPDAPPAVEPTPVSQPAIATGPPPVATPVPVPVAAPAPQPAHVVAAEPQPRVVAPVPARTQPANVAAPAVESVASDEHLVINKSLKKRVTVAPMESDSVASGAPPALASELARSLSATLTTTGLTLVDKSIGPAIRVSVTSFHNTADNSVNTGAVTDAVRGIGSFFGRGSVPNAPARARTVNYDVALSLLVSIYDAQGRPITSSRPNCALKEKRTNVTVDPVHLAYGGLVNGDTPPADAMRQVVAAAADTILGAIDRVDAEVFVKSARGDKATLDVGRDANVAPDDRFDVLEGDRVIARIRVDSVQDNTASGTVTSGATAITGKRVRYVGTSSGDSSSGPAKVERYATLREKTDFRVGPGLSFKQGTTIAPGTRVRLIYAIGGWARIDHAATAWVPMTSLDLE